MVTLGSLQVTPAQDRPDLLAPPTLAALRDWEERARVGVAPIDADLADTAAFCQAYDVPLEASANCVVLAGKREGQVRMAACLVLATTRADVNGSPGGGSMCARFPSRPWMMLLPSPAWSTAGSRPSACRPTGPSLSTREWWSTRQS